MHHAQQHAETRTRERRRRLAVEAARWMAESGQRDFAQAKRKAAERLGILEDASLPRNREIQEALLEHQRLFQGDEQPQALAERREAALHAMHLLASFEPRLVGPVLEGSADAHSAVNLHVFSDDPQALDWFLSEHGIPFDSGSHRYRANADAEIEVPTVSFTADGIHFELSLFPLDGLRQSPLDRIDRRPMQRAALAQLQELLDAS
ncbi:MAG: hypothetical protein KDI75_08660 [Xanthomonadales bacterium]|nr:hypothetical protein [Xanthomonadales bacterium]